MMKKKVISFLLIFSLLFTVSGASFIDSSDVTTNIKCYETSFSYEGENIPVKYYIKDGAVTYAEIGDSIARYIDGNIYLDSKLVATVTTDVARRTGWIYDKNCPYGLQASDFNILVETRNHNITFKQTVVDISIDAIIAVFLALFPFDDAVGGQAVFMEVAESILEGIINYDMSPKVYAREQIFKSNKISYTHKNAFNFYSDPSYSDWIGYALAYSSWA